MHVAATIRLVGITADDEGGEAVGIGFQEIHEFPALDEDGAGGDALGDGELAEPGRAGGIGLVVGFAFLLVGGCGIPGESGLLPAVFRFLCETIDGKGCVRAERGEAELTGDDV